MTAWPAELELNASNLSQPGQATASVRPGLTTAGSRFVGDRSEKATVSGTRKTAWQLGHCAFFPAESSGSDNVDLQVGQGNCTIVKTQGGGWVGATSRQAVTMIRNPVANRGPLYTASCESQGEDATARST